MIRFDLTRRFDLNARDSIGMAIRIEKCNAGHNEIPKLSTFCCFVWSMHDDKISLMYSEHAYTHTVNNRFHDEVLVPTAVIGCFNFNYHYSVQNTVRIDL